MQSSVHVKLHCWIGIIVDIAYSQSSDSS